MIFLGNSLLPIEDCLFAFVNSIEKNAVSFVNVFLLSRLAACVNLGLNGDLCHK